MQTVLLLSIYLIQIFLEWVHKNRRDLLQIIDQPIHKYIVGNNI